MCEKMELEKGLCWFYENEPEIKSKQIPEEKSHALTFEAGIQFGRKLKEGNKNE
jgi:hypothetical protein